MSLKAFHVVFVVASILLSGVLTAWSYGHYSTAGGSDMLALAILGVVSIAALIVYGVWFLKKMKGVSYL